MNAPSNNVPKPRPAQKNSAKTGKNKRRKAKRRQNQPQAAVARTRTAFRLSPCAEKYYDSLLDPFDGPADACVPILPSFPSQKLRVFSRGSFATSSANSNGFVFMSPTASNDGQGAFKTGSTFAGTTLSNGVTGVSQVLMANSPFTASDFSSGYVQARCVSAGLRVRYSGTKMNAGGTVYILEHPNHQTLVGYDTAAMMALDRCLREPLSDTGAWHTVCWAPVDQDEMDYLAASNPAASTAYPLAIFVVSATAGVTLDYEVFANWEIIGSKARGLTKNSADPTGLALVQQTTRSVANGQIDSLVLRQGSKVKDHPTIGKVIGNIAKNVLTGFMPKVLPFAAALL